MKYLTIILVIFIFFLIFTASYAQKSDAPLEIFLATEDATGKTMDFITESNTTPIWYPLHPHEIDTDNWDNPALLTVTGNDSDDEQGWDINNTPYKGNPQLGKAELYTVTVSVSGEPSKDASFTIESYGGDFNGDVDITYNYADDKFYYRGTSNKVTHLNMYDDPGWLEPTAPQNFICKNSTSWGNNPKFEWERPEHPKRWSTTLYYHIYRKVGDGNYIQLNATATLDTSFTDSSATLDKFGNTTYYYVTAKGSDSPESDPSDVVQIKTNLAEKSVPGDQQFNFSPENNIEDMSSLSIYPNPFNPITHISYYLPHDSYVQMVIYNITGQKIEKLVNGYQYRGEYAVNFNGQSLAGGIYFIRLISNEQMITKKVLLFK